MFDVFIEKKWVFSLLEFEFGVRLRSRVGRIFGRVILVLFSFGGFGFLLGCLFYLV